LRSGFVRIRLAFFFAVSLFDVNARSARFGFLDVGMNFVQFAGLGRKFRWDFVRMTDAFSGKRFYVRRFAVSWHCRRHAFVRVAMIIILEVLENVADVEEGVAIETDIDERRLHTGEDSGDSAFVDAANEREFFFALDIDFD
jgi:hypothetical protein